MVFKKTWGPWALDKSSLSIGWVSLSKNLQTFRCSQYFPGFVHSCCSFSGGYLLPFFQLLDKHHVFYWTSSAPQYATLAMSTYEINPYAGGG